MSFESPKFEKKITHPEITLGEKPEQAHITPEAQKDWEREHSVEAVKSFIDQKLDVFPTEENRSLREKYKDVSRDLEKEKYNKALEHFERVLGDNIEWDEDKKQTLYKGAEKQEQIRNFVYGLTNKLYERHKRELKPADYTEISEYLKREVESWKSGDVATQKLEKAVRNRDYKTLADQIDLSIKATREEINETNTKEGNDAVQQQYHVGNARAFLIKKLEDLRRYRKYLYEMI